MSSRRCSGGWPQPVEEAAEGGKLCEVSGASGGGLGFDDVGEVGDGHAGVVADGPGDRGGGKAVVAGGAVGNEGDVEWSAVGDEAHDVLGERLAVDRDGDTVGVAGDSEAGVELDERGALVGQGWGDAFGAGSALALRGACGGSSGGGFGDPAGRAELPCFADAAPAVAAACERPSAGEWFAQARPACH